MSENKLTIDPADFDRAVLAMCSLCDAMKRLERFVSTAGFGLAEVEEVAARRQSAERLLERISHNRAGSAVR
ncbi:hypothetical protein [Novosphingobium sp. MBES04]|uniref:hypothetical protein n=1 Tax=Novosphingobium sp. MBES04 TaxID=1206458 RepID=UPI000580594F|nr:hypothetical protein [Novosphingobium sp. MBES04]